MPSRLLKKLIPMLAEKGIVWPGGIDNCIAQRTYAGHWERSRGTWSWYLVSVLPLISLPDIGSCDKLTDCVKFGFDIVRESNPSRGTQYELSTKGPGPISRYHTTFKLPKGAVQ